MFSLLLLVLYVCKKVVWINTIIIIIILFHYWLCQIGFHSTTCLLFRGLPGIDDNICPFTIETTTSVINTVKWTHPLWGRGSVRAVVLGHDENMTWKCEILTHKNDSYSSDENRSAKVEERIPRCYWPTAASVSLRSTQLLGDELPLSEMRKVNWSYI